MTVKTLMAALQIAIDKGFVTLDDDAILYTSDGISLIESVIVPKLIEQDYWEPYMGMPKKIRDEKTSLSRSDFPGGIIAFLDKKFFESFDFVDEKEIKDETVKAKS